MDFGKLFIWKVNISSRSKERKHGINVFYHLNKCAFLHGGQRKWGHLKYIYFKRVCGQVHPQIRLARTISIEYCHNNRHCGAIASAWAPLLGDPHTHHFSNKVSQHLWKRSWCYIINIITMVTIRDALLRVAECQSFYTKQHLQAKFYPNESA